MAAQKKARSEALSCILSGSKSSAILFCPDSQEEEAVDLKCACKKIILFIFRSHQRKTS